VREVAEEDFQRAEINDDVMDDKNEYGGRRLAAARARQ
jgi:hypothetical protein